MGLEDADVLSGDLGLAHFYEAALAVHPNAQTVANWTRNEVLRDLKDNDVSSLPFAGTTLGKLVALVDNNTITAAAGKEVFAQLLVNGGDPATIVAAQGLQQVSDPAQLQPIIAQVIAANSAKAAQYRSGKTGLLGFFVGQAMRESGGKANPQLLQDLVRAALDE